MLLMAQPVESLICDEASVLLVPLMTAGQLLSCWMVPSFRLKKPVLTAVLPP